MNAPPIPITPRGSAHRAIAVERLVVVIKAFRLERQCWLNSMQVFATVFLYQPDWPPIRRSSLPRSPLRVVDRLAQRVVIGHRSFCIRA